MVVSSATVQAQVIPNDPLFQNQVSYYFEGGQTTVLARSNRPSATERIVAAGIHLDASRAWALTTGTRAVVVAVLDDGFFYDHEDIRDNVWQNLGEVGVDSTGHRKETNGIDDDGNGYVDDVMGWDFVFDDPDPEHYVFDGLDRSRIQPHRHAISALGIIGAKGNNGVGIAGINWDVSMMLLKIGAQGVRRDTLRVGRAAEAIRYAVDNGARIINWSGFVSGADRAASQPMADAIDYAAEHGVLLVVAAGNRGHDLDDDTNCIYPQCFDTENMIRVAELDFDGALYRYEVEGQVRGSNYGAQRVEVAAIAQNYSTALYHGNSIYGVGGGTSDAAPVVTGVAALVLSLRPDLSAVGLKEMLVESAVPLEPLKDRVRSGGVINAYAALKRALQR